MKAILQYTAIPVPGADLLSQGAGMLNADGAWRLAAAINPDAAVGTFCRIEEIEELRERIAALEKATRPPITTNQKTKR